MPFRSQRKVDRYQLVISRADLFCWPVGASILTFCCVGLVGSNQSLISKSTVDAGWARTAVSLDFGILCFSKSLSDQLSQRLLYNFVLLFHLASQKKLCSVYEKGELMNQSKQWYPLSLIREKRGEGGECMMRNLLFGNDLFCLYPHQTVAISNVKV